MRISKTQRKRGVNNEELIVGIDVARSDPRFLDPVEVFYNRFRRHSALGYKSPEQHQELLDET